MYVPEPINTDDVKLPEELTGLIEQIAENVHEVWAKSRMDEGWVWGPEKDSRKMEHPDLVPYDQLTEKEKDYDRNTAMATLKLIAAMGYEIRKKS